MERSTNDFPRRLIENAAKFAEFQRGFDHKPMLSTALGLFVFTGLIQLVSSLVSRDPAWRAPAALLIPWILSLIAVLLMFATGQQVRDCAAPRIPPSFWLLSTFQLWWVASLAWFSHPAVSTCLFFIVGAGAFNDARYLYDTAAAKLSQSIPLLTFPGLLLAIDALGGPGLLDRYARDPNYVITALCVLGITILLVQLVLSIVGDQWFELDRLSWTRTKLEAQLAEERRASEVIRRSCDFMLHGVSAGVFSHDVASPLSRVSMTTDQLEELVASASERLEEKPRFDHLLGVLRSATDQLVEMSSTLARSLRRAETPASRPIAELVAESVDNVRDCLRRDPRTQLPVPTVDLAPDDVFVVSAHVSAVANILANGARYSPTASLDVRGRRANDWYYVLSVRDFGVAPEQRAAAIGAVRKSLAIHTDGSELAAEGDSGYGVALMLAKLVVVRHGGWLDVAEPASGPGLVLLLVLPRHDPRNPSPTTPTPDQAAVVLATEPDRDEMTITLAPA